MSKETGNRLRYLADELYDGNQSDMARDMGMSPQGMNNYFGGEREPGNKILKRLVAIGVNATWVLTGIEPIFLKDIKQVQDQKIKLYDSERKEEQVSEPGEEGDQDSYFGDFNTENLSDAERRIFVEVKEFSDFLRTRDLPLEVKRMLLQLMIEQIDRAAEQLQDQ